MYDYEERFGSLDRLYGEAAMSCVRAAHVCVVGLGGVGSWVVESLARCGIGRLTLVDGDTISGSNINRQLHSLGSTLDQTKTSVLRDRVADINPECVVDVIDAYIDDDNLRDILERETEGKYYNVVIDAIDSIKYKAAMIYCCKRNRIPIVTTGGAGGLTDPTQVEIRDLTRTWNDPLAASVRSRLRFKYGYTRNQKRSFGVPCVFSPEQQRYPDKDGNPVFNKPGVAGVTLDCAYGFGSSVMVTASFGFAASARAIQIICKSAATD